MLLFYYKYINSITESAKYANADVVGSTSIHF